MTNLWPLPTGDAEREEVRDAVGHDLAVRLAAVRLCVFDCDGVLTSGSLVYGAEGEMLKEFHARDGLGLVMLRPAGIARAVLTGRTSPMVERRCRDLKFEAIKMGRFDKLAALEEIWRETGFGAEDTLYMGDDLLDLPALVTAAVAVSPPEAPVEVTRVCDWVCESPGGAGAVRDVCDLILKARGAHGAAIRSLVAGARPTDAGEAIQ